MSRLSHGGIAGFCLHTRCRSCLRASPPFPLAHHVSSSACALHCPFCLHTTLSLSLALSPGTGGGFCSPVPFFFPFSCFARVQTTTFALLYPKKADFRHIFGYRWRFLSFCTRKKLISDMFSGTGGSFCPSVPVRRHFYCSARVQMTTFALLYPCAFFLTPPPKEART